MLLDPSRDARRHPVLFLLGPAGSGKTTVCIDRLRAFEGEGRAALCLVPEQSTYLADRQLLEPPGPQVVRHVQVLSFHRLAHLLAAESDPAAASRIVLDPAARRILLRRLFARCDAALARPFASLIDRPRFLETLLAALREIRLESVAPGAGDLGARVRAASIPEDLRGKLLALAALQEAYEAALRERDVRDADSALLAAPAQVRARPERFRGKPVLVDGFLSFTRVETEILAALHEAGAELTIALCLDPKALPLLDGLPEPPPPGFRLEDWPADIVRRVERPVFLGTLRTYVELSARLRAGGFARRIEELQGAPPRYRTSALASLQAGLLADAPRPDAVAAGDAIELIAARDPTHEVETWARRIDRWIRLDPDPVRPGEIAVITRDLERYRPIIEETFARYRIPVFVDRHWDLSTRPLVRLLLDALDVLRARWSRDAVVSLLRSPLLGAHPGEVDLLENLALENGKDYHDWCAAKWEPIRRPPREDPDGTESEAERARDEERFRFEKVRNGIADAIRRDRLDPLRRFELSWPADGSGLDGTAAVAALRAWMKAAGVEAPPEEGGVARKTAPAAEGPIVERREWDAVSRVLDQLAGELEGERVGLEAFATLLRAGFDALQIGRTPTRLDQVTVAEVQRSRLGEVRRAIVGGLSASDFPRPAAGARFLTDRERAILAEHGLPLGGSEALRQEEEIYFFYIALTRASERLLLTRPATDLEGRPLEPSPFLRELLKCAAGLVERSVEETLEPAELSPVQTAGELAAHIGAYIASRLDRRRAGRRTEEPAGDDPRDARILAAYHRVVAPGGSAEAREALSRSSRLWGYDNRPELPASVVAFARAGRPFTTSAGRLESFARCPYQHFGRHWLRLSPRPRPQVRPIDNGLLVHRALEMVLREGLPGVDREQIARGLEGVFDRLGKEDLRRAYEADPSGRFRWRTVRGQLLRFLDVEAARLAVSRFQPYRFEVGFGEGEIEALAIDLPGGGRIYVRGRLDRIDVDDPAGPREAIVIDYKTRHQPGRGRPADVTSGLDLQMAVYMLALKEVFGLEPKAGLYAAVLPSPVEEIKDPPNPLGIELKGLIPEGERQGIEGAIKLIHPTRPPLKTASELREILERARATMASYGTAMERGRIDVAPIRRFGWTACRSCELMALCRMDEAYNPPRLAALDGLGPEASRT